MLSKNSEPRGRNKHYFPSMAELSSVSAARIASGVGFVAFVAGIVVTKLYTSWVSRRLLSAENTGNNTTPTPGAGWRPPNYGALLGQKWLDLCNTPDAHVPKESFYSPQYESLSMCIE
jgi:hypothetical protein